MAASRYIVWPSNAAQNPLVKFGNWIQRTHVDGELRVMFWAMPRRCWSQRSVESCCLNPATLLQREMVSPQQRTV